MKKISMLLILFALSVGSTYAQTWDEWFQQKKTRLTYLTQQIVALQVYEGYLQKGYTIAKNGLNTMGAIKGGEFSLHQQFFAALSAINPALQHDSQIADIITLQNNTVLQYRLCMKEARESNQLSGNEINYISSVFTSLLNGCTNDIGDLASVTTFGKLQLSDDERLKKIDAIYKDIKDKNAFTQSFSNEVRSLVLNRQKEQNDISSTKALYNLK